MKTFKRYLFEQTQDYKGQHEAPDREGGAPMHDVSLNGIYPKDFYSHNGFRYYSDHGSKLDSTSHYDVHNRKDKPWSRVPIYRAVPKDKKIKTINPGDWVTHNRSYAQEHGRANIGVGKYKILTAHARAHELFTDGNSIHEWGYHPHEMSDEHKAAHALYKSSPEFLAKQAAHKAAVAAKYAHLKK